MSPFSEKTRSLNSPLLPNPSLSSIEFMLNPYGNEQKACISPTRVSSDQNFSNAVSGYTGVQSPISMNNLNMQINNQGNKRPPNLQTNLRTRYPQPAGMNQFNQGIMQQQHLNVNTNNNLQMNMPISPVRFDPNQKRKSYTDQGAPLGQSRFPGMKRNSVFSNHSPGLANNSMNPQLMIGPNQNLHISNGMSPIQGGLQLGITSQSQMNMMQHQMPMQSQMSYGGMQVGLQGPMMQMPVGMNSQMHMQPGMSMPMMSNPMSSQLPGGLAPPHLSGHYNQRNYRTGYEGSPTSKGMYPGGPGNFSHK